MEIVGFRGISYEILTQPLILVLYATFKSSAYYY